jgi:2-polyprenyl-3-methyl-5-hydroxy-6-metoxy-1,4-benzoquinol methylase
MIQQCVIDNRHSGIQWLFKKKDADIYRCTECGCIMADITFKHDQYESADYYTMSSQTKDEIDAEWGFRWRHILSKLRRTAAPNSRLLDVGAGNGYFIMLAASEFGFHATGLEISQRQIDFARDVVGVNLLNERIEEHNEVYDIVTAFNVIEHVPDPGAFLSVLTHCLRPGGILVITTPNPGCIHARIKGLKKWGMIDPPHHINLFTLYALRTLLRNHGLVEIEYETISTYIRFVRRIDTRKLLLRKILFCVLRATHMGADHSIIVTKH